VHYNVAAEGIKIMNSPLWSIIVLVLVILLFFGGIGYALFKPLKNDKIK